MLVQGGKLISDFINVAESEGQREALLQTVEHYRATVPDLTKASLAKC